MDKELLSTMIPMIIFKKEIYDFVERLMIDKASQAKQLLTTEEAAKLLNIKVSRLRRAVFRKEISYIKLGALVRFREEDLTNYIESNIRKIQS